MVFAKIGTISQRDSQFKATITVQEEYNTLTQICFRVISLEELDIIPSAYFLVIGK